MNNSLHPTPSSRWHPSLWILGGAAALLAGCSSTPSHRVSAPPPAPPTLTTGTTATPVIVANPDGLSQTGMPTATLIVTQGPPTAVVEAVPAQPSGNHRWVPGYWTWRNSRYEWMAGHWEVPPFGGASWVAPRWEREGNSYRFYEGTWR